MGELSKKLVEQKITRRVSVAAGATGEATVEIPAKTEVWLKGYGYTWAGNNVYQLNTGLQNFPKRSDQEGSVSQPVIYGQPFKCDSGGTLKLVIENNDSTGYDYDIVFYILTSELLQIESSGQDLSFNTGLVFSQNELASAPFEVTILTQTGSGSITGFVSNLFDLDNTTYYGGEKGGSAGNIEFEVVFDTGSIKNYKAVNLAATQSGAPTENPQVKIDISDDDSSYTNIINSFNGASEQSLSYDSFSARYIKLYVRCASGTTTSGHMRILELSAYKSS